MRVEYNQKADLLHLRLDLRCQEVINRQVADDVVIDIGQGERIGRGRESSASK